MRKFDLNYQGVGRLLRCKEMQNACDAIAARIQPEPEYIHGAQGKTRYHVLVHTNTPQETLMRFYSEASN
jgi:hypothetical protein